MGISKEEKERRYYNKKLIKEGLKDEIKKPHKIDLKELISNIIGLFLGMVIYDITGIDGFINNNFVRSILKIAVLVGVLMVVKFFTNTLTQKLSDK